MSQGLTFEASNALQWHQALLKVVGPFTCEMHFAKDIYFTYVNFEGHLLQKYLIIGNLIIIKFIFEVVLSLACP